jgi:hypothetical protein
MSGELIFQGPDGQIIGFGGLWSSIVDRRRPDQTAGSVVAVEFDGYVASSVAQQLRIVVASEDRARLLVLGTVDLDPTKVGWRHATDRGELNGVIDTVEVNGRVQPPGQCLELNDSTKLRLSGWALDMNSREPVSAVMIVPAEGQRIFAGYGYRRPDVAREFGAETATFVGWNAEILLGRRTSRGTELKVELLSADGLGKKVLTPSLVECGENRESAGVRPH